MIIEIGSTLGFTIAITAVIWFAKSVLKKFLEMC